MMIATTPKKLQFTLITYISLSVITPFLIWGFNNYYLQPEYFINTLANLGLVLILIWSANKKEITRSSFIGAPIVFCLIIASNLALNGLFEEQFYNLIYLISIAFLWITISNYVAKSTIERLEMPVIVLFTVVLSVHLIMVFLNWNAAHLSNRRIFNNYGQFSNYIALFFPFLLSIFFFKTALSRFERFIKVMSLVLSLLILAILMFNNVRTAWLPCVFLLVGCCFKDKISSLSFKYGRIKQERKYTIVLISFVLLLFIVLFSYFIKKDSADGRFFIWQISWSIFLDYPLTGVGFNQFPSHYNIYQANYFKIHDDPAHAWLAADVFFAFNEILQSLVELGIIAIGLWAFVGYKTIKILRGLFSNWQINPSKQWLSVGFLGFVCIVFFQVLFSYPFKDQSSTHTIFIINLFYITSFFAK